VLKKYPQPYQDEDHSRYRLKAPLKMSLGRPAEVKPEEAEEECHHPYDGGGEKNRDAQKGEGGPHSEGIQFLC